MMEHGIQLQSPTKGSIKTLLNAEMPELELVSTNYFQ